MEILYKNKNFIVVYKDPAIPSQSDQSGDEDAMTLASKLLTDQSEKGELWLVHRLDRVVGGIVLYARNKRYAAILSDLISSHAADKEYLAVVEGSADGGVFEDLLYKDSAQGKSFVVDRLRKGVKEAKLEYVSLSKKETDKGIRSLVKIKLYTGRYHQIRAQFSSRALPIVGDGKYGSKDKGAKMPALFSYRLAFSIEGKKYEFIKMPDKTEYPWCEFEEIL